MLPAGATDGDDFSAGSEAVEFAAPTEVAACTITGQPEDEAEEIAEGIKPAEAERAAIADDAVSDGDGLEDAVEKAPCEQSQAEGRMGERGSSGKGEYAEGKSEGESGAEVSAGT